MCSQLVFNNKCTRPKPVLRPRWLGMKWAGLSAGTLPGPDGLLPVRMGHLKTHRSQTGIVAQLWLCSTMPSQKPGTRTNSKATMGMCPPNNEKTRGAWLNRGHWVGILLLEQSRASVTTGMNGDTSRPTVPCNGGTHSALYPR